MSYRITNVWYNNHMKISSLYLFGLFVASTAIAVVAYASPAQVFASTCVQITAYINYGQTDSVSGGPVITLQNFLQGAGYLTASPNGHFGGATLSAVKAYQSDNGISATGFVGPLTLALINSKTCPAGASANPSSNTSPTTSTNSQSCPAGYVCTAAVQSISTPTPSVQTTVNNTSSSANPLSNMTITSPATGQVLSMGSSTVIRWNNTPTSSYSIVLEQPGGIGAGFIAQDLSSNTGNNQYVWSVGKIFSSDMNSNQNVTAGTYRIRLEGVSSGALSTDPVSGWFTIVAPQFVVNSVVPSSAYADDATSVVLFGSGFTTSASVYFGTNNSSLHANNTYVSPDGTVLVFTIPTTVPAGPYTLFINNGISSSPATLPFIVSSIQ